MRGSNTYQRKQMINGLLDDLIGTPNEPTVNIGVSVDTQTAIKLFVTFVAVGLTVNYLSKKFN